MTKPDKHCVDASGCRSCFIDSGAYEAFPDAGIHGEKLAKRKLLLHSCCGPCSSACIEKLQSEYDVTVFFFNPNITDQAEYEKRRETQIALIRALNDRPDAPGKVGFLEGPYDPEEFFRAVRGFEEEPEGGARCPICFRMRLEETAKAALQNGFDMFTTTLTVSPHKSYPIISALGKKVGTEYGIGYLDADFKKKDGFKRSIELSKKYHLYRQNYCGCEFSKWEDEE